MFATEGLALSLSYKTRLGTREGHERSQEGVW